MSQGILRSLLTVGSTFATNLSPRLNVGSYICIANVGVRFWNKFEMGDWGFVQMLVLRIETSLKWVIGDLCKCWCYVLKQVWNGWLGICANVGVTFWNKFEMGDWGFVQMLVLRFETSLKWVIGDLCKCWCYVLKQVWNGWLGICANVGVTYWNKFEMDDWGFVQMLVLCIETSLKWVIGDLCKCWCYVLKQVWNGWLGICANVGVTFWNKFEMGYWGFVQMLVLRFETSLKWVIGDLCWELGQQQ
jgi:hypothetical protein